VSEFELALINVVLNARDAMPEGGAITITAENVELDPGQGLEDLAGEFVAIAVADTGCGIPADILPKVFEPFFTTKRESKGTGLGLPQVHGFAHQSGGTVTVQSELGRGTCVTIFLPRGHEARQSDQDVSPAPVSGGLALLVEDDPEVAEATSGLLAELGFKVEVANDAGSALAAVADRTFDLVLSDVVMAGPTDGIGLARMISQDYPNIPIVLATGYSEAAHAVSGDFTLLRKPYQLGELSRAIAKVIAEKRESSQSNVVPLRRPNS
jgi:CheY-like chemotaxis protein